MAGEKHLYLTISGDCSTSGLTSEVWQTGIRLALVGGTVDDIGTLPTDWAPVLDTISRVESSWTITGNWKIEQSGAFFSPDDYLNDQVAPAVAAWMAANKSSNQVTVREMKLYPIVAPLGHAYPAPPYASGTPCLLTMTDNSIGGAASGLLPLQNTVVASHRSSQIGRVGRGRMYLPPTGASTVSNGLVTDSNRDDILDAQVALLEGLAYSAPLPTGWHLRPCITGKPYTQYSVISQVRVGNVMDTQQRRRRQIVETYSSASPTY